MTATDPSPAAHAVAATPDTDPPERRRFVLADAVSAERAARVELSLDLRTLLGLPFAALGRTPRTATGRFRDAALFEIAAELPSLVEWLERRGSRRRAEHLRSWLGLADVPHGGYSR